MDLGVMQCKREPWRFSACFMVESLRLDIVTTDKKKDGGMRQLAAWEKDRDLSTAKRMIANVICQLRRLQRPLFTRGSGEPSLIGRTVVKFNPP